jgi:hypothetical protein
VLFGFTGTAKESADLEIGIPNMAQIIDHGNGPTVSIPDLDLRLDPTFGL